jgi:hypothetical protein
MPAKIAVRERLSHREGESFIERVIGLAAIPEVEHVRLPRFIPEMLLACRSLIVISKALKAQSFSVIGP